MTSSVFLNNLDDFISPSQACVNPFVSSKLEEAKSNKPSRKHGRITIETEYDMDQAEDPAFETSLIKPKSGLSDAKKTATVTLNDCLACSGCVTSAEAILVQEQSVDKFIKILETLQTCNNILVIQISPNSQASIAEFLGMDMKDFFLRLATILKSMGVLYVLDSSAGADVALVESREEFVQRFQSGRSKAWVRPETTTAESSTSMSVFAEDGMVADVTTRTETMPALASHLPVFTSHCPGWVCYAEKTAPQALPYMSTVKSAQQIVGSVVKSLIQAARPESVETDDDQSFLEALSSLSLDSSSIAASSGSGKQNCNTFVVSVQPCFDKKLEASRKDFYHNAQKVAEVDMVLSTTELWQLLESCAWKWSQARSGCAEGDDITMISDVAVDFDDQEGVRIKRTKPLHDPTVQNQSPLDFMDLDSAKELPPPVGVDSPLRRSVSIHTTFAHVFEYFASVVPDTVSGRDHIEALFRTYSPTGQQLLVASERNMSSGGYAEYLFRYAAQKMFGVDLWATPLVYKEGRNTDMSEVDLATMVTALGQDASVITNSGRALKFARAYGFRNVQSVMLKMKRGACDLDLVELMACPSGCSNGGGQLKSMSSLLPQSSALPSLPNHRGETPQESKNRIRDAEQFFHNNLAFRQPDDSALVRYLYNPKLLGMPLSDSARQLLHTRYHAVPKLETIAPLAAKW